MTTDPRSEVMIAPDLATAGEELRTMIAAASAVVPFTGAGISTECGIPDFRSPGGIWTKNRPIPFDEFLASQEARNESWRRRFAMGDAFGHARPGRGHRALASLYRLGKVPAVVTQNIDNLHQASGIAPEHVVELHGNTTYAHCLDCERRYELAWVRERMDAGNGCAPDCQSCGGFIKTATISFGQAMPDAAMHRAQDLAASCDLFLSIGTSLVVWPAAGFPLMAKRNGARLVIINREPTDFDDIADLVVRDDIGTVLEPFADDTPDEDVHRL
jgi:NAD-dependent deacetylase